MSTLKLILLLLLFGGLAAFQWIPETLTKTTYACPGDRISFGWNYSLEPGETVENITWLFASSTQDTTTTIATDNNGTFMPVPSYGTRLTQPANGIVELSGVTPADSGTYTVEVMVRQTTGSLSTIRRDLVVAVPDPSLKLTMKMEAHPVPDANGEFHVRLSCGMLPWRDEPPFKVVWKTPSDPGQHLASTGFQNGSFFLTLDNPVKSDHHECKILASDVAYLCKPASAPMTASLTPDAITVHVMLLEAKVQRMTREFQQLKGDNHQRKLRHFTVDQQDTDSRTVGFHGTLSKNEDVKRNVPINFNWLYYNGGNAYNKKTGIFTAPKSGTYFFAATILGSRAGTICSSLITDSVQVAYVCNKHIGFISPATFHAVVYLVKGRTAWVRIEENHQLFHTSMFTGILIIH